MALRDSGPEPAALGGEQTLVLRLDPLHNWSDIVVLGFAIVFTTYMALGELLARGWAKDSGITTTSPSLRLFPWGSRLWRGGAFGG